MKQKLTIPLQIKNLSDREFEGHGSIFNNVDLGGDVVMPGAFKRTLANHRRSGSLPQMFWMHDPSRVPGKWLEMSEDEDGLIVKGVLADTPLGNEIQTLLKMDAVKGLSIGYSTAEQDYDKHGNRLLKDLELWEVSVVSLPMNPLAQVTHAKSQLSEAGEYVPTVKEFERILRDAGCSRTIAKNLVHNMLSEKGQREAGDDQKEAMHPPREAVDEATDMNDLAVLLAASSLVEKSRVDIVGEDEPQREAVDMSDEDIEKAADEIARAANLVAERMYAATIKKPRL